MAHVKICIVIISCKNMMPLLDVELIMYPTEETNLCVLYLQNNGLAMYILSRSEMSQQRANTTASR